MTQPIYRRIAILVALTLVLPMTALASPEERVRLEFEVDSLLTDDGTLVLVVGELPDGEPGRWRLEFRETPRKAPQIGERGHLTCTVQSLQRSGPARVGFKGSDEELQAVVTRVRE